MDEGLYPADRVKDRKLAIRIVTRLRLHPAAEVNIARALHRHDRTGWLLVLGAVVIWTESPPVAYGLVGPGTVVELATITADLEQ